MDKWEGQVAVVTGASAGIGKAIAIKLAQQGMTVAALARRGDRLKEMSEKHKGKGSIKGYICDVSKESDVEKVFNQIQKDLGKISVLVNNAGVALQSSLMDFDFAKWRQMFDVNVFGMFACIKQVIKAAKADNDKKLMHIFNINSIAGHQDPMTIEGVVYSATKHNVTMLTKSLLRQLAVEKLKNIRITSISPGLVETEIFEVGGWKAMDLEKMPHLSGDNIANGLIAALSSPDDVVISEITMKPAGEMF